MFPSRPPHPPNPSKPGVEKSPFQITANQLEIDEIVNRAHLRTQFLAVMS